MSTSALYSPNQTLVLPFPFVFPVFSSTVYFSFFYIFRDKAFWSATLWFKQSKGNNMPFAWGQLSCDPSRRRPRGRCGAGSCTLPSSYRSIASTTTTRPCHPTGIDLLLRANCPARRGPLPSEAAEGYPKIPSETIFHNPPQDPAASDPDARCPHPRPWRRLRAKQGFTYFACRHCNKRWRPRASFAHFGSNGANGSSAFFDFLNVYLMYLSGADVNRP